MTLEPLLALLLWYAVGLTVAYGLYRLLFAGAFEEGIPRMEDERKRRTREAVARRGGLPP